MTAKILKNFKTNLNNLKCALGVCNRLCHPLKDYWKICYFAVQFIFYKFKVESQCHYCFSNCHINEEHLRKRLHFVNIYLNKEIIWLCVHLPSSNMRRTKAFLSDYFVVLDSIQFSHS